MRGEALFINGVWANVMEDILLVQKHLPEQILYVQPYSGDRIVHLAENSPSVDDPVRLLMSVTDNLAHVHYICEIVGWDDKRTLAGPKLRWLNRIIYSFQWTESGVFKTTEGGIKCANLLYVRRMKKLSSPLSISLLTKTVNDEPLATTRASPGGWAYVRNPSEDWLAKYL